MLVIKLPFPSPHKLALPPVSSVFRTVVPNLGPPDILGLQLPEAFNTNSACQDFWELKSKNIWRPKVGDHWCKALRNPLPLRLAGGDLGLCYLPKATQAGCSPEGYTGELNALSQVFQPLELSSQH